MPGLHLYVFVDESNTHSPPGQYVVAGCWCLSTYEDLHQILQPTVDRLRNNINGMPTGELKGHEIPETALDSAFAMLRNYIFSDQGLKDKSIDSGDKPWQHNGAIAFSLYDSDSSITTELATNYLGQGADGTISQVWALSSLISPLFRIEHHSTRSIEKYTVILDSSTWDRPTYVLQNRLNQITEFPTIHFETVGSHNVPGIQIADLTANIRRRQLRNNECKKGIDALNALRV